MRYLCLVYLEEEKMRALSPEEGKALDRESIAYDEELQASGHYIASDALQPVTKAVTVRRKNGVPAVMDGPFAETKEHLGGFILIEAADLDEAIRIASDIPVGRYGAIEVRPVMEIGAS
jgi:hypothetical protein